MNHLRWAYLTLVLTAAVVSLTGCNGENLASGLSGFNQGYYGQPYYAPAYQPVRYQPPVTTNCHTADYGAFGTNTSCTSY